MTQFKTISELTLLYSAYHHILDKWVKESDRYANSLIDGKPDRLAEHRRDKYSAQLDELHEAILKLEKANELPDFNSPEAFFCEPD